MNGKQIMEDVLKKHPNHHHPRLLLDENDMKRFRENRGSAGYRTLVDHIMAEADKVLGEEPRAFSIPDGIRLLMVSHCVHDRVKSLSFAYRLTGEKKYAERAWRELENAGNFETWHPYHFLDVAVMCYAFALGYDWLYDYLSEEQKAFLRSAMIRHGLLQGLEDIRDVKRERTYRWYQQKPGDNWKFICDGGLSMVALAIFDDEPNPIYEEILGNCFDDSYTAVRDFYGKEDGSYCEGPGYWDYATIHLAYYSSSLISAAGSDYGMTDWVGLRISPYFMLSLSSPDMLSFNFGDGGAFHVCDSIFLWYGKMFGDHAVASLRATEVENGTYDRDDLIFFDSYRKEELGNLPLAFCGKGWDHASIRSDRTKDAFFAAIHYGTNGVPHGHLDVGTFIMNVGSTRFFADLGGDNYNLRPYGGCYRYRAEGHNTLVFNHSAAPDQYGKAKTAVDGCRAEGDSYVLSDISSAYPEVGGVHRGLKLYRETNTFVLQDEILCAPTDEVRWSAHTKAHAELSADRRSAVLTLDGKTLNVSILTEGLTFDVRPAAPDEKSPKVEAAPSAHSTELVGQNPNTGYSKLVIEAKGSDRYTLAVAFRPEDGKKVSLPPLCPMENW